MGCTSRCWTPVPCPECGNELPPRGRDVAPEYGLPDCCERHRYDSDINPRHLWNESDSDRAYVDPEWVDPNRSLD
jgi:hypothetical protein